MYNGLAGKPTELAGPVNRESVKDSNILAVSRIVAAAAYDVGNQWVARMVKELA
jgi:hypothetical protein